MKKISSQQRILFFFAAAVAAYTLKSIFVGADIDESYGVTLGYRIVQGDRLLLDMWEPHQTSAIFTAAFIRLILVFTGGSLNFLTVLLRVCFFGVQAGISVFTFRTFQECLPFLERKECLLFGLIYFITTPKCIYIPEYSNLHVWFSTLMVLFLMRYYCKSSPGHGRIIYLTAAGAMLACDVLAYPSIAILFPVCILFMICRPLTGRLKEITFFSAPCVVGSVGFVGYLFSYMTLKEILEILPYILGDGSHQSGLWGKVQMTAKSALELFGLTGLCSAAACVLLLIHRKRKPEAGKSEDTFAVWLYFWFLAQVVLQCYCWFVGRFNSGYPQLPYFAVPFFGVICCMKSEKKEKRGWYMILLSTLNLASLVLFSNWRIIHLIVYLVVGLLGGLLCWRQYFSERMGRSGVKLFRGIMLLFLVSEFFGRTVLMIGGDGGRGLITEVRGISRQGVRGGILSAYMNAYRYNNNFELFDSIVEPGSMVLYLGPSQFYYMLGDCRIAAPSTISTPVFDEGLEKYYELHPERFPDVVIMESCYGDVSYFAEDDYIMDWIERCYQPAEVTDYPYVRVYSR